MNKILFSAFAVVLMALTACYKTQQTNTSRPSARTTEAATPSGQSTVSPEPTQATQTKTADINQAISDYNAKNYAKAETGFKAVIDKESKNAQAHFYLGKIIYERKDYDNSLPHFEEAVKIDYKSPEKMMALGDNQRALKKFDKAIVQYQKVIGFEPNNAEAYYALGLTYIGLNNKIGARQQLQKLTPLNKSLGEKLKQEIEK